MSFKRMNIMHVGWGYKPWWDGGYIEYLESLMKAQKEHGCRISYFSAGRYFAKYKMPRLIQWEANGINFYEILNTPIVRRDCSFELSYGIDMENVVCEDFFRKALEDIQPGIIHFHHLMGLPSSFIDIVKDEYHIPSVLTVHDYHLLCSRTTLFDYQNKICQDRDVGRKCAVCLANLPYRRYLEKIRVEHELRSYRFMRVMHNISAKIRKVKACLSALGKIFQKSQPLIKELRYKDIFNEAAFRRRREINIRRLQKIDCIIIPSRCVHDVMEYFLGKSSRYRLIPHALKHIEKIKPVRFDKVSFPIKFVVLNVFGNFMKGSQLVSDAMKLLKTRGLLNKFQLHINGNLLEQRRAEILQYENVIYHGLYHVSSLNKILKNMHVGIIPSLNNEIFGIVGIEFLAKGIPIVGNNRGGITDYTIDNFTGWVNKSAGAEELADIVTRIINNPHEIAELNKTILQNRGKFIKNMDEHFTEIEGIYKDLSS